MKRDPLPQVYGTLDEAIEIPEGIIGRNQLVVKHKSADELMHYTRNDEG
jgi:hypothetical protein